MFNSNRQFNHGSSFKRYGRPNNRFSSNRFSNNRSFGKQRRIKSLPNDPALFTRKAVSSNTEVSYVPQHTFDQFEISDKLKANIASKGFIHPTQIQDQAINPILEGQDVIGIASTGTGKTAAFLIPTIDKIYKDPNQGALIIAPTRELAVQIHDEIKALTSGLNLSSTLVIGGANMSRQIFDVKRNPHFIVSTPGRLKDLIRQKVLFLEDYNTFVLDEVDLMVDIGFLPDVKYFVSLLPKNRQSLFFSATISPKVQEILKDFVKNPITISVKKQDTSENVDQDVVKVTNPARKIDQLHDLLIQDGFDKVLIFGRTKHGMDKLHKELDSRGFKAGAIHGNKSQAQRQKVLHRFKQNEIQILLATDVASRGLDINNVTHVINYDLPETYEDYIHRIGRTGRANKKGVALTFIN